MKNSPFKFLAAYEQKDYSNFFGRDKETAQLYNAVHSSNLTLLYGASGTGKTSLINCGLGNKFYPTDWLPIFIRRENDLNKSFEQALYNNLNTNTKKSQSKFAKLSIQNKIELLYSNHFRPIYLIFDQFEELFVLGKKAEQEMFYQSIKQLLTLGLQAKIIIIIREEWIAYLNKFEKVIPDLFDNRLRIEKMNDHNLYNVIAGSCQNANIEIRNPKKTIPEILENIRNQKEGVELTNLQVYLDRLYKKAAKKNPKQSIYFDSILVKETGKMDNVLSSFLDEQFDDIKNALKKRGVAQHDALPMAILFSMVTSDKTKRVVDFKTIHKELPANWNISSKDIEFCLKEFSKIRILTTLGDN